MSHRDEYLNTLHSMGVSSAEAYARSAFSRNIGLLAPGEQERLAQVKVAIPGMGGVGGVHLINLVRTGFMHFHLADFDHFEPANVNRQYGARVSTFSRPKLDVLIEDALAINPFLEFTPFPEGVTQDNLDAFLSGTSVVLDGLDFFQLEIRRALFNRARERGIPVITAGPLGYSSALLIFSPEGMGFDDYFAINGQLTEEQKYLRFAMGLAPRPTHIAYMDLTRVDLKGGKGPSLNVACQLCSALAVTEAVRIALAKPGQKPVPHFLQIDPFRRKLRQGRLVMGNRSPIQRAKLWYVQNVLLQTAQRARPQEPPLPQLPADGATILSVEMLTYLVQAGIQAPSGDNAQPWKFAGSDNSINIFLDPGADQSFFNFRQTASIIAAGAAVENIRLAAGTFGLETDIAWLPDSSHEHLLASMQFQPGSKQLAPLADQIWSRCTNRRPYAKSPLPTWLQTDLHARIADIPGARLHLLTTRAQIRRLAKVVYLADRIRSEHQGLHEHFTSMIRFTDMETQRTRDGLPLKNLEAGLPGEMFLRLTKPWKVMNAVNRLGLGRMVALHSAQGILTSGGVGMVVADGLETKDFLTGGQALQRIWLALSHHGLQMQPMTAVTLFWLRWLWEGPESFSKQHQRLLKKVWPELQRLFPDVNFEKSGLVMLFRTGFGPGIRYRTLRKDAPVLVNECCDC